MGDLARYRLFLTFVAVPVVVIVLIVFLLVNAFGGDEQAAAPTEDKQSEVLVPPTLAISVVTVAPNAASPGATITPTSTALALATSTPTPTPQPPAETPAPTPTSTPQEYEVQPDDTLSEIADSFGLTTSELAAANEIEDTDDIKVGDILIIPPPASGGERTPLPSPTATPTPISATVDPAEGLNVREEPTTDTEVLEILPESAEILLTGTRQTIDDIEWVEIVDGGWVQRQYLTIEGE